MQQIRNLIKSIGPGILFAGAAIGASHLVQSTRAGAGWGWQLLIFIILANFFKYPFFEYGHRYVAATGKSIIEGYKQLGSWAVWTFFLLNIATSVISTAGVSYVTAALSVNLVSLFFDYQVDFLTMVVIIMLSTLTFLFVGKYKLLDNMIKLLIFSLSIFTLFAFIVALSKGMHSEANFHAPPIFDSIGFAFLISLMGWMPAPIEAGAWASLWAVEKSKQNNKKPELKNALLDFNIGYISTAILAVLFLGLGALVMYGTGEEFSSKADVFAGQIISLYTNTLGDWSLGLISVIALITMASTAITVIDAYPRSLHESIRVLFQVKKNTYTYWAIGVCAISVVIISFFLQNMKAMVDFATLVSFLAAPVFGYINWKTVKHQSIDPKYHPNKWLNILSLAGLVFLSIFSLIYLIFLLV